MSIHNRFLRSPSNGIPKDFSLCVNPPPPFESRRILRRIDSNKTGTLVDATSLMQAGIANGGVCSQHARRSTELGTCMNSAYGHMCAPGWITTVSMSVWDYLLGATPSPQLY